MSWSRPLWTAVKIRLRPVIMTSLAFFFGTLPLALTKGAGAGGPERHRHRRHRRHAVRHLHAIFFIPFFFVLISRLLREEDVPGRQNQTCRTRPAEMS